MLAHVTHEVVILKYLDFKSSFQSLDINFIFESKVIRVPYANIGLKKSIDTNKSSNLCHKIFKILIVKELEFIQRYYYFCECYNKELCWYYQRFSRNSSPKNEKITDIGLLNIYSYCRAYKNKHKKSDIFRRCG